MTRDKRWQAKFVGFVSRWKQFLSLKNCRSTRICSVLNRSNRDTTVYYRLIFCAFSWPNMVKWRNSGIIIYHACFQKLLKLPLSLRDSGNFSKFWKHACFTRPMRLPIQITTRIWLVTSSPDLDSCIRHALVIGQLYASCLSNWTVGVIKRALVALERVIFFSI